MPQRELLRNPSGMGLQYREVNVKGSAGNVHGWFLPAVSGQALGTVLFAHGNGENISTQIGGVYWLPAAGFNVLIFDYRGYGLSTGEPSPAGVVEDIQAMIAHLQQNEEVRQYGLVVYGHSMGGSAAISAVASAETKSYIRGLVVESAFSGYRKIAKDKLSSFWLTRPFGWVTYLLIGNDPCPLRDIGRITGLPVMVIHSRDDEIVPFAHGQALYEAANEPKKFWWLQNKSHNQGWDNDLHRQRFVGYLSAMFDTADG
jgi:fermentation-respiration switch protein FrsA (DUF1100 family)